MEVSTRKSQVFLLSIFQQAMFDATVFPAVRWSISSTRLGELGSARLVVALKEVETLL